MKKEKEFNLSEKRKELKSQIDLCLRALESSLRKKIVETIFDLIERQDKEFIKKLKDKLLIGMEISEKARVKAIQNKSSLEAAAHRGANRALEEFQEEIDKLAGKKLI